MVCAFHNDLLSVCTAVNEAFDTVTGSRGLWDPDGRDTSNQDYIDESKPEKLENERIVKEDAETWAQYEAERRAQRSWRLARMLLPRSHLMRTALSFLPLWGDRRGGEHVAP